MFSKLFNEGTSKKQNFYQQNKTQSGQQINQKRDFKKFNENNNKKDSENYQQKQCFYPLKKKIKQQDNIQNLKLKSNIDNDLKGSKFRLLNEFLYTQESQTAQDHFQKNSQDFELYHEGFKKQTEKWPQQPIKLIIKEIEANQLFHHKIICDLGCGEGELYEYFNSKNLIKFPFDKTKYEAKTNDDEEENNIDINEEIKPKNKQQKRKSLIKKIYSFDLVSAKDHILAFDIAKLPLKSEKIDIAVFCLALMGTNYLYFILEASRCLKTGGFLIVSEVVSRLLSAEMFVMMVESIGFELHKQQKPNDYFTIFYFQKNRESRKNYSDFALNKIQNVKLKLEIKKQKKKQLENCKNYLELSQVLLKPCLYKKR